MARGSSTVRAGRQTRHFPAGTTVAEVKGILAPAGRAVVLLRGNRVLRDSDTLAKDMVYVAIPEIEGG